MCYFIDHKTYQMGPFILCISHDSLALAFRAELKFLVKLNQGRQRLSLKE